MMQTHATGSAVAVGEPAVPLSTASAALWGAFLHEGLMISEFDGQRPTRILEAWGGGCRELVSEVCGYVELIHAQVQLAPPRPPGYPGVFEYDVPSTLGRLVGDYLLTHRALPAPFAVAALSRELVLAFFVPQERSD